MTEKFIKAFDTMVKDYKDLRNDIDIKKTYFEEFLKKGFPNKRLENWKFSDMQQIINKNIGDLNFYKNPKIKDIDTNIFISKVEHNKILVINGKVEKIELNSEDKSKVTIEKKFDKKDYQNNINSLVTLNNVFLTDYNKIILRKNSSLKKPLIIYHQTNNEVRSTNINSRIDFVLEENSELKLIDIFIDKSEKNFSNILYNIKLKKNSILKNYKIDKDLNDNVKYFFNNIDQDRNSISETFILSAGSKFLKNEINCNLNEEYSSAFINGIFNLVEDNHHEIRSSINHLTENTKSYQLIKSILDDRSKSVYQGKIFVDSKAQKTDGYQLSKAILLSEKSEFNAKPELEIYADDVKCSHGSASGNLDENSIFYLMSRGLNYREAKQLIINGFMLEVIEKITDEQIKELIKEFLGLEK